MDDHLDQEDIDFFWARVEEVRRRFDLNVSDIAKICGYERSAYHRAVSNSQVPRLSTLLGVSRHFRFPVHYWLPPDFAPKEPEKWPTLGDVGKCLLVESMKDLAPLTKQIVDVAQTLGIQGKRKMLDAGRGASLNDRTLAMIKTIEELPEDKLQAMETVLRDPMRLNLLVGLANVTPAGLNRAVNE